MLIVFGNIRLIKSEKKDECAHFQNEVKFNYHGIENALCGKTRFEYFTPKRILVIQMK